MQPGADPTLIRLRASGAERTTIDAATGDLILETTHGSLRQRLPHAYQQRNGTRQRVDARHRFLEGGEIALHLGAFDRSRALVIDPVLEHSTYLGGSSGDIGLAIAVDASGNAHVTGYASSTNFPTADPLQPANAGNRDAFVAKLDATGSALLYSTYLGGTSDDFGRGIAVDAVGNTHVTGHTVSTNFPTASPLQPANAGFNDAFVTKLDATGSALLYSTYLGGTFEDYGYGIAVDAIGNAHVIGDTWSTDFPTASPLQPANAGSNDAFVTKLDTTGSALLYSTFLGGTSMDAGGGIALDASGNAYVTGYTISTDFPTANPLQPANAGFVDAFVTKLDAAGSALLYSTYVGGFAEDGGNGIAVDASGNAHITGSTASSDFPTASPLQPANAGAVDAFVTKVDATGSAFVYSTYLGGSIGDTTHGIAVDASGNAHVIGNTTSADFPTASPLQPANAGNGDAFVTKLDATGSAHLYSTYLGGAFPDHGFGIAVDTSGNAHITGLTASADFPTASPLQPANAGSGDGFIVKITVSANLSVTKTDATDPVAPGQTISYTITASNGGTEDATNVSLTDTVPANTTFVSFIQNSGPTYTCTTPPTGGTGDVDCTLATFAFGASATFTLVVAVDSIFTPGSTISNSASISSDTFDPDTADNDATETTVVASGPNVSGTKTAAGTFEPGSNLIYTIVLTNTGALDQPDNAGDEFIDVLPPQLDLITASASSGTVTTNLSTNTVRWNGSIAGGGTVTITIQARIDTDRGTISNQGTIYYDANLDGVNESTRMTDDPATAGSGDATIVQVAAVAAIPTLSPLTMLLFAAGLALASLLVLKQ